MFCWVWGHHKGHRLRSRLDPRCTPRQPCELFGSAGRRGALSGPSCRRSSCSPAGRGWGACWSGMRFMIAERQDVSIPAPWTSAHAADNAAIGYGSLIVVGLVFRHDDAVTLLLPPRLTASATEVREAASRRGMSVVQLGSFDVPAGLRGRHVHAGPTFVDVVAPRVGITALEAPIEWLPRLPRRFTGRRIETMTIDEAHGLRWPAFIKSPNDKSVRAMIYADGSRLPGPDAIDPRTPVLVSEVRRACMGHRPGRDRRLDDGRRRLCRSPGGCA
jgi:hypothetical protein